MQNVIRQYGIDGIWHFTDETNLSLIIREKGLLSYAELVRRCIEIPTPGGNQLSHNLDRHNHVDDYVHLSFLDDHPMLYRAKQENRITEPVWLKVEPTILLEEGVMFCSEVSNKTGATLIDGRTAANTIDFEVLFTRTDWSDPNIQARRQAALKSEILVPIRIPFERIMGKKNG